MPFLARFFAFSAAKTNPTRILINSTQILSVMHLHSASNMPCDLFGPINVLCRSCKHLLQFRPILSLGSSRPTILSPGLAAESGYRE